MTTKDFSMGLREQNRIERGFYFLNPLKFHQFSKNHAEFGLIFNMTISLLSYGTLFVFVPMEEQIEHTRKKWERTGLNVLIDVLNPYNIFQEVEHIREKINKIRGDLIILDCLGYSLDLKKKLQKITGKPVILPRSLLGMAIREIL